MGQRERKEGEKEVGEMGEGRERMMEGGLKKGGSEKERGGGDGGRWGGKKREKGSVNPTSEKLQLLRSYSFCYVKHMLWVQVTVQ